MTIEAQLGPGDASAQAKAADKGAKDRSCAWNSLTASSEPWARKNWFRVLAYVLVWIYLVARLLQGPDQWRNAARSTLAMLSAVVFVNIFTDPIPLPTPEWLPAEEKRQAEERNRARMNRQRCYWMIFAYGFMLLSLLLPIYASLNWTQLDRVDVDAPMAVFVGCSLDDGKSALSCLSPEQRVELQMERRDAGDAGDTAPQTPSAGSRGTTSRPGPWSGT